MKTYYEKYKEKVTNKIEELQNIEKDTWDTYGFAKSGMDIERSTFYDSKLKWIKTSCEIIDELNTIRNNNSRPLVFPSIDNVSKRIQCEDEYFNETQNGLELVRIYWEKYNSNESGDVLVYIEDFAPYGFEAKKNEQNGMNYLEAENMLRKTALEIESIIRRNKYPLTVKRYEMKWARGDGYKDRYKEWFGAPYRCAYCGEIKRDLEIDHIYPVLKLMTDDVIRKEAIKHGITRADSPRNLVCSCHFCNQSKGSMITDEWIVPGLKENERLVLDQVNKVREKIAINFYEEDMKKKDENFSYISKEEKMEQIEEETKYMSPKEKKRYIKELKKKEAEGGVLDTIKTLIIAFFVWPALLLGPLLGILPTLIWWIFVLCGAETILEKIGLFELFTKII